MELNFNVTGARRKDLVDEIAAIDGSSKEYLGVPSCAYRVGDFHISKGGTVTADDRKLMDILESLKLAGFEPVNMPAVSAQDAHSEDEKEDAMNEPSINEEALQGETCGLAIEMPLDGLNENSLRNLDNLIKAKGYLIRKAIGVDDLPIEVGENTMKFPWFSTMPAPDEINAFSLLISKLCEHAKNQKRINAREKEVENEKYAFRCFLLRLGFIGNEYKAQRKILLSRLSGSSAFKAGRPSAE